MGLFFKLRCDCYHKWNACPQNLCHKYCYLWQPRHCNSTHKCLQRVVIVLKNKDKRNCNNLDKNTCSHEFLQFMFKSRFFQLLQYTTKKWALLGNQYSNSHQLFFQLFVGISRLKWFSLFSVKTNICRDKCPGPKLFKHPTQMFQNLPSV